MKRVAVRVLVPSVAALLAIFSGLGGCPTGTPSNGGSGVSGFNLAPIPIITADVVNGVAPLTVSFSSDRSTDDGLIVSRNWDFDDGGASADISPRHSFVTTGEYTVTLTLTDDNGAQNSDTVTIVVTQPPIASFTTSETVAENAPATIHFDASATTDPDGTVELIEWEFGDGSRESGTLDEVGVIDHVFATSGTFRVRLTATDDVGIIDSADVFIQVGIAQPTLEIRIPPATVKNLVVTEDTSVWIQGVFDVEPSVPHTLSAGLDGDTDICNAKSIRLSVTNPSLSTAIDYDRHYRPVTDARFSPDGTRVLSSSRDGTVQIYDAANGFMISSFTGMGEIGACAYSPDGSQFIYGQDNGLLVLRNAQNGAVIRNMSAHGAAIRDIDYVGSRILSGAADRHVILWNAADGTVIFDIDEGIVVNAVALSPSGNVFATGGADGVIRLFNASSGSLIRTFSGHTGAINDIKFSPDGTLLVSGSDDNTAKVWAVADASVLATLVGHTSDVLAVAFSLDADYVITGGNDRQIGVWERGAGTLLSVTKPCDSPITSLDIHPGGDDFLAGVGAYSDIQLDVNPANGNDLNFTVPQALQLANVTDLGGADVPIGIYHLWAEIDTDRTEPTREYADTLINVVAPFPDSFATAPPVVPLLESKQNNGVTKYIANVALDAETDRQIFDLGPMEAGDRIQLSIVTLPGYGVTFTPDNDYSLMLVDASANIFAWFQNAYILYTPETRLVVARNTASMYLIVDGGYSINVQITRATNLNITRSQRVLVNFAGADSVGIAGEPVRNVPVFNAADFNQFFGSSPNWGATETTAMEAAIMARLRAIYADYDVTFVSSTDVTLDPTLAPATPYITMHVGGFDDVFYGLSDYIDPRNDTATGTGITFSTTIALVGINNGFNNPINTPAQLGFAIGTVAAHEVGHLLGLRHTDNLSGNDLMSLVVDPTDTLEFTINRVVPSEQYHGLPALGIQDAPMLLEDTVGLATP